VIAAVLDSNVLASGFVRPASTPGTLLRLWVVGAFALVVSEHMLDEVARTLEKPYFTAPLSPALPAAGLGRG
jgi:predicted nucleic acid-binding protein